MRKFVSDAWLKKKEKRDLGIARSYTLALVEEENEKEERRRERERARRLVSKILALTPLSKVQKEVVNMFLEGLSLREIARERGVYFRAVQKSFQSALRKMKETVEKYNIDPEEEEVEFFGEYGFDFLAYGTDE